MAPIPRRLALAVLVAGLVFAVPSAALGAPPRVGTYSFDGRYSVNLYDARAVRWQDPDYTACTAASTLMMLNMIAYQGSPGPGFQWTVTTSSASQSSIMTWARAHDTLSSAGKGSDPHGWRNALNRYGWNDYADEQTRVYEDRAYGSYDAAVHAAVIAIAQTRKPVGILAWAGGHAQILHGYTVVGADPARSTRFRVESVYLTDPLKSDGLRNARLTDAQFKSGALKYRFRAYAWRDSPKDDPYTAGTKASHDEWYGKWVIIAPRS